MQRSNVWIKVAAVFAIPVIQAVALQRAENFDRRPAYSGEPIERHLRLNDGQLEHLVGMFHACREEQDGATRPNAHTSATRIKTFLHYLASGGFHRQIGFSVGLAKSTAILHECQVADFLYDISAQHIAFPRQEELEELGQPLMDINGVERHVVLFIDGVIIKIQRPDHAGYAYFCGRHGKSCDSINVQYVVDRRGRVRYVITGLPGAVHDKTAAEWSEELIDFLHNLPENYVILGDPAYRNLHPAVMHSFIGRNLNEQQLAFNDRCKRIRQIVERSIGATELKWQINQMKENRYAAKYGVVFASKCTIATCVLHNLFTNFLA